MVAFESSYEMEAEGETATLIADFDFSKSKIAGTIDMKNYATSDTVTMLFENDITDTESDVNLTLKKNDESLGTASLSTKLDGENISINGEILSADTQDAIVSLKCEGSLSDVKKGKSYSLNLDSIEFKVADLITFDMSAEVNVNTDGTIEIPDSKEYTNLFDMTTEDIEALITEIQTNGLENEALLNLVMSIMNEYQSTTSSGYDYDYGDDYDYDDIDDDDNDYTDYTNPLDNDEDDTIISFENYEGSKFKLVCSDKTAKIDNYTNFSTLSMNDGNYSVSISGMEATNEEDAIDGAIEYYKESYDTEISELQTYKGFNYKIMSYEYEDYTFTSGNAVIKQGDSYIFISINDYSYDEKANIEDAVKYVLDNISLAE
ncbi:hypothetical protein [Anaerosporobacter sp.]